MMIAILLQRWENFEDKKILEKIQRYLEVIWKYAELSRLRKNFQLDISTLEELEQIERLDRQNKKLIYAFQNQSIGFYLRLFSNDVLEYLLRFETSEALLAALSDQRTIQYEQLKQWEQQLSHIINKKKHSWKNYLSWFSGKIINKIYRNSLIGLNAELAECLGKKSSHRMEQWINQQTFLGAMKFVGGATGVALSYSMGLYSLFRILIVDSVCESLQENYFEDQIDDWEAKVTYQYDLMKKINFTKTGLFIVLFVESLTKSILSGNSLYMIQTIGGISGSLIANYFSPPQKHFISLFFTMLSYSMGSAVTDYGARLVDKLLTRSLLEKVFCEWANLHDIPGCITDFSKSSIYTWDFWALKNDKVHFSLNTQNNFYNAECEIVSLEKWGKILVCDKPEVTHIMPLTG